MTELPENMNEIEVKDIYEKDVLAIWEKFENHEIFSNPDFEYRKHPLLPKIVHKESLMFIGMNPSFTKGSVIPENEKKIGFYQIQKQENFKDIPYFEKMKEIAEYCKSEWTHLDLFFIRETKQELIEKLSYTDKGIDFLNAQLKITFEIIERANPKLIIVDEPELNLNPGLACRFWDILENELPESIFIYATHCVSFAMRRHVDYVIVLSKSQGCTTSIENLSKIPPNDLRELLGAIPSILSSSSAIAVEGTENSFDQAFYRWLLNDNDKEVIPVGGCSDVHSVANKTGIWEKLAPSVKIVGVVDSDYRNEGELSNFKNGLKYFIISDSTFTPDTINTADTVRFFIANNKNLGNLIYTFAADYDSKFFKDKLVVEFSTLA